MSQSTGIQFINSYLPTFLKQLGLGTKAFTYTVVNLAASMVAALGAMYLYDRVGRRPLEISGAAGQVLFMFLFGGLASAKHQTQSKINGVVVSRNRTPRLQDCSTPSSVGSDGRQASLVLFSVSARISHSSCCWIMTSEMGGVRMRRKSESQHSPPRSRSMSDMCTRADEEVMTWGTSWDVVFACVWTVSVPYMLVTLGARAPYIVSVLALATLSHPP
jgi:hypothetical protein